MNPSRLPLRSWQTSPWRKWRWGNKVWAHVFGFFWIECPVCDTPFGGHESGPYALILQENEHGNHGKILCWKHDHDVRLLPPRKSVGA